MRPDSLHIALRTSEPMTWITHAEWQSRRHESSSLAPVPHFKILPLCAPPGLSQWFPASEEPIMFTAAVIVFPPDSHLLSAASAAVSMSEGWCWFPQTRENVSLRGHYSCVCCTTATRTLCWFFWLYLKPNSTKGTHKGFYPAQKISAMWKLVQKCSMWE